MKKIIKLTESDLTRIVKRVINEQAGSWSDENSDMAWQAVKDLGPEEQFKYLHDKTAEGFASLDTKIDRLFGKHNSSK